ncbi:MAG: coagulation factor 5/8 type domain protein [Verrucomicrobiales bacterium]|nr:coagulation factor 5/8 type domain protein [Verrucomicrobiales bacterium]
MKNFLWIFIRLCPGLGAAAENSSWVRRLAFWAAPALQALEQEIVEMDHDLAALPSMINVNSGNRNGFQTSSGPESQDLWVEVELPAPSRVDRIVLVPLLARAAGGQVPGFGFPSRFVLEGTDAEGESVLLMDETGKDFPNPGAWPVSTLCPPGTVLQRIRLLVTEPWQGGGPPVLALSEMLVLQGNRNLTLKAKVRASSSREIPPTWSKNNLIDLMMPLGLPVAPDDNKIMGWHGPVAAAVDQAQSVTIDLGRAAPLDEIRLVPAVRSPMVWDSHYGFPTRFKVETALTPDFAGAVSVHDRTGSSLLSPGQNLQCFPTGGQAARYVRVTASRLRERGGDFVFALGELQAFSGDANIAAGSPVLENGALEETGWSRAGLTDNHSGGGKLLELPEWIGLLERRRTLEGKRAEVVRGLQELFNKTEHTLVGASVFGAGGIVLLAGLFSWRGHRHRVLDRERHRERLARDLHDELGSNLGSIALISSFAQQEEAAQMRMDLAEIERVARESADSMRDMVSLLAGKRGGAGADWLIVMTGLAERLMRGGVALECRLPTAPLPWVPNLETRREIYLFCKEVLHNAARHGRPSSLNFRLSPTPAGLRVEIRDDGCGFTPSQTAGGHGLGNLRERAAMLKGTFELQSAPGAGTSVVLEIPRNRRWIKC